MDGRIEEDARDVAESSTRTVERALAVLASVCERDETTLAGVARDVELPPSTALRLLRTLETSGFLAKDDDSAYRPGPRLLQIGAQAFSKEALITLSQEPMQSVVGATGESVYLSIPGHRQTALYVSITEGTYSVRHTNWVGRTVPLEGSAVGVVMRGETPEVGYVVLENTIEEDVTAICAPIQVGPRVVGAMSTLVPTYRLNPDKQRACGEALVKATHEVSAALGAGAD